jgi:hypothetical protein
LFRAAGDGAMKNIRFPKWTKVQFAAKDRANVMASLSNGDPLLIEKAHGKGRVILCTVPLDRSWESNFPSAWEFPVLLHELACYLARARSAVDSVSPDLREADLTRSSVDDWRKVRERLPVVWREDAEQSSLAVDDAPRGELWWMLLAAVVALLCLEIWMTRRMAIARG